ncbi:hypothetical protein GCM10023075_52920 [Streptosporangium album]
MPGPGQGAAAWVGEHGAHLMDYAVYHLAPDRAPAAVASVLAACQAQPAPRGITARGRLLAALRQDCRAAPGYREQYVPESGPGMPDVRLITRVWTIVDPLGTETLRLMYRHELTAVDLSHVLAMPAEEVARLATRTQDLIETLVSGLDAIVHDRHTCPELSPLADVLFPGGLGEPAEPGEFGEPEEPEEPERSEEAEELRTLSPAEFESARTDLLSHMITCSACIRPINIRYTVPQMISNPRISPLTAKMRKRLLGSLPPPVKLPLPRVGTTPAPKPDPGAPERPQEETQPGRAVRPARSDRSTLPYLPVQPDRSTPHHPARPAPSDRPRRADRSDRSTLPYRPVLPDRSTLPSLPARRTRPPSAPPTSPISPAPSEPSAPSAPGHDTPLYDALLSQARAREVLSRTDDVTATNPAIPAVPGRSGDARVPAVKAYAGSIGEPEGVRFGPGVRFAEALAWAGERVRSTTIKITIIVVAGATGTVTGMNLLGPVIGGQGSPSAMQSSTTQTVTTGDAVPAPAVQNGLAERVQIPPVVTLDEFGQGSLLLTVSEKTLEWRITAPGLSVTPSSGTLKQGRTDVINLRALRIRRWCGVPATVTAPLTFHGPTDSITTTVRWLTC